MRSARPCRRARSARARCGRSSTSGTCAGGAGLARAPGADRQVPGGRDRGGRGLVADGDGEVLVGGRDGAHRGGGHPLRRLGLLAAARLAAAEHGGARSKRPDRARWRGSSACGPDERAVRRQGRRRSTSWRSTRAPRARCPFVTQGDRRAAGEDRGAGAWSGESWRSWTCTRGARSRARGVKESVFPFVTLPGVDSCWGRR